MKLEAEVRSANDQIILLRKELQMADKIEKEMVAEVGRLQEAAQQLENENAKKSKEVKETNKVVELEKVTS